jgi:hypothetical protein
MHATLVVLGMSLATLSAHASITPLAPFTGDRSEPLNYPGTTIVASFPIFANTASLDSFNGQATAIHYLLSDTFIGDLVTPRTGGHILGFTSGPGIFVFDTPVRRFGAYFNNNSGMDDATCDFYGPDGTLLGSVTARTPAAGNQWVWNGWESTAPFSRIAVTGNGVIDGFLWFDDLEVSAVPTPSTAVAGAMFLLAFRRRR